MALAWNLEDDAFKRIAHGQRTSDVSVRFERSAREQVRLGAGRAARAAPTGSGPAGEHSDGAPDHAAGAETGHYDEAAQTRHEPALGRAGNGGGTRARTHQAGHV